MTPADLITAAVTNYDGTDANDADAAPRRAQVLLFLQHVHDYVWNLPGHEWQFTFKEDTTLTITSSQNSVAVPADFGEFGQAGSLYDTSRNLRLTEVPLTVLYQYRRAVSNRPIFAVFAEKIQIPYPASSDIPLAAFFRKRAPTLADGSTPMEIPDRYAHTVLIPGTVMRMQQSKNDSRQDVWAGQFRDGLAEMCVSERPVKTEIRRMPLAYRGAW